MDELEVDDAAPTRRGISRRHAIAAAGAAGMAAWVAPQIHSIAVAQTVCGSPSSCTATAIDWLSSPFVAAGSTPFNGSDLTTSTWSVNGTVLTVTRTPSGNPDTIHTISNGAGGTAQTTAVVKNQAFGCRTPFIPICRRENASVSPGLLQEPVSLTFAFNPAVYKLSFELVDIDASGLSNPANSYTTNNSGITGTRYKEENTVTYVAGSGAPNVTYTIPNTSTIVQSGSGSGASFTVNTTLTNLGTANASNFSTTGCDATSNPKYNSGSPDVYNANADANVCNVLVSFDGCGKVSSVTIASTDLNTAVGTDATAGRSVGVASMRWCP